MFDSQTGLEIYPKTPKKTDGHDLRIFLFLCPYFKEHFCNVVFVACELCAVTEWIYCIYESLNLDCDVYIFNKSSLVMYCYLKLTL